MSEPRPRGVRVVLFDVDGTLVRAGGAGRRALDRAFHTLWGVEDASRGMGFAGKPDLQNFRDVYRKCFGRLPDPGELRDAIAAYLRRLPGEVRRAVREKRYEVVPGARELLRELSRMSHVRVGLGTGNLEEGARIKLRPARLNRYFRFGGFGMDGLRRERILRTGVRRARVRAREVVIVGDTPKDVEAGRRAGYRTAAVGSGFASLASLKASRPDHLARDFRALDRWLDWLGGAGRNGRRSGRRAR